MASVWDWLSEGFDYDLWANRRWLANLQQRGMPEPDAAIFGHILAAQDVWSRRVRGESPAQLEVPVLKEASLEDVHARWRSILESVVGEGPLVRYRRTTGEERCLPLQVIARHVINHGTYHRGELRGLCRAAGYDGFPDTDMAGYFPSDPN